MREFIIARQIAVAAELRRIEHLIRKNVETGLVSIRIGRPSKSREMEKKYHAMIRDIATTHQHERIESRDTELWKAILIDAFEQEYLSQGKRLSHPGRFVWSLDGLRLVSLRPSSAKFTVQEGKDFIQFLYVVASEYRATLSEPSLSYYEEVMRAA